MQLFSINNNNNKIDIFDYTNGDKVDTIISDTDVLKLAVLKDGNIAYTHKSVLLFNVITRKTK